MSDAVLELILRAKNEAAASLAGFGLSLRGASKDVAKLESDVGHLAGGGSSGGKGFGALGSALGGLGSLGGGPIGLVVGGLGALTAGGAAVYETYKNVEVQTKQLDAALAQHGITVSAEQSMIDANTASWESYGYSLDQVRPALVQMTMAGLDQKQQMAALPVVMDLARAKNLDLLTATQSVTRGLVGNVRALSDLGIKLPPAALASVDLAKAQKAVDAATQGVNASQANLTTIEDQLAGKTTLTTAEQNKLAAAHAKAETAAHKLHAAQDKLNRVQSQSVDNGKRLTAILGAITGATGDQRGSIDSLAPKQAALSNQWEEFATRIGPGVEAILGGVLDALTTILGTLGDVIGFISNAVGQAGKAVGDLAKSLPGNPSKTPQQDALFLAGLGKHAAGGWVGLAGPELGIVGEQGPEFIAPAGRGGGGAGVNVNVTVAGSAIFDPFGTAAQHIADALLPGLQRAIGRNYGAGAVLSGH